MLSAIEPTYKPYSDALAGLDQYYVNLYIGNTQKALYDQYANQCTGAVEADEALLTDALSGAGSLNKLDEKLIDAATAVSGCGPAFAYMFIEALADGGVKCGLPRDKAQKFAAEMLLGAAKLCLESGIHPGELKDAVCSPGGSTIAGVATLEDCGFRGGVIDAVEASFERTKELSGD